MLGGNLGSLLYGDVSVMTHKVPKYQRTSEPITAHLIPGIYSNIFYKCTCVKQDRTKHPMGRRGGLVVERRTP